MWIHCRKMKFVVVQTMGLLAWTGCGGDDSDGMSKAVKVGMTHDVSTGRGDKSFNDAAANALDQVHEDLKVETKELFAAMGEDNAGMQSRLEQLAHDGYNPIIAVGFGYAEALTKVAAKYSGTHFAIIDSTDAAGPTIANLVFAEEQGSFLVGAAAALKSTSKSVGFIGGVRAPLLDKFEAGFRAGAGAVDKNVGVNVEYLSEPPDYSGFSDPAGAKTVAEGMYDAGADVIFVAAGGSAIGVLQAAKTKGKLAIGIQYSQADGEPGDLAPAILTSMIKRVDVAVFDFVREAIQDRFTAGAQVFDLKVDGVGYAKSGGKIDDIAGKLDDFKQQIIDGKILVPKAP